MINMGNGIGEAWLVVFSDPEPILADDWRRVKLRDRVLYRLLGLLKPGFRHVWAMRRAENFNGWVVLNVGSGGVALFEVRDGSPVDIPGALGDGPLAGRHFVDYHDLMMAMDDAGLAHIVVAPVQPGQHWRFRGLFTCVSAVKHVLGIQAPWVWTPWSLHKHLSKAHDAAKRGGDG